MKRTAYFLTVIGSAGPLRRLQETGKRRGCHPFRHQPAPRFLEDAESRRHGHEHHECFHSGEPGPGASGVQAQDRRAAGRRDASRLLFGKAEWPVGRAKHAAGRRIDPASRARRKSPYERGFTVVGLHAQFSRSRPRRRKFQCPSARTSARKRPRKYAGAVSRTGFSLLVLISNPVENQTG